MVIKCTYSQCENFRGLHPEEKGECNKSAITSGFCDMGHRVNVSRSNRAVYARFCYTCLMDPMPTDEEIKKRLTPEEYHVLREKGTEAAFSGDLLHVDADGAFVCKVCGNKLFESDAKFDSGTGWPSFDKAIA